MLLDCFMFNNELDLLELRLNELDSVVDQFVLVESTHTFSALPKPLYFNENKSKFKKFLPKIRHIVYDGPFQLVSLGAFDQTPCHTNERNQRDAIMRGLDGCGPEDVVWLSDLDEIPCSEGAEWIPEPKFVFNMKIYIYFMNYRVHKDSGGTVAVRFDAITTPNELMLARSWGPFRDGGWHFSYMGGAEKISKKFESICHQEYNNPEARDIDNIKRTISAGGSVFSLPDQTDYMRYNWGWPEDDKLLHLEEVDDSFPRYMVDNIDKFEHLIAYDIQNDVWSDKFK